MGAALGVVALHRISLHAADHGVGDGALRGVHRQRRVRNTCLSQVGPSLWIFLLPITFLVQFIFNIGIARTLSPACMLYPDVHRVVRVFSTLYRYLSPVIYGLAFLQEVLDKRDLPQWIYTVYVLNPLAGILNAYHAVIFPDDTENVLLLLGLSAGLSAALFVFGWYMFKRLEPRVLKEL